MEGSGITLIYLASPYSIGDQALNVRRQIETADKLLAMGHMPFAPLLFHLWHLISPKTYDEWLAIGMAMLERCDAILRLGGESKGADREVIYAYGKGKEIYFDINDIPLDKVN